MEHIPEEWLATKIIHLGAVAKEINPDNWYQFSRCGCLYFAPGLAQGMG